MCILHGLCSLRLRFPVRMIYLFLHCGSVGGGRQPARLSGLEKNGQRVYNVMSRSSGEQIWSDCSCV